MVPSPESPKGDIHIDADTIYVNDIVIRDAELAEIIRQSPESRWVELG